MVRSHSESNRSLALLRSLTSFDRYRSMINVHQEQCATGIKPEHSCAGQNTNGIDQTRTDDVRCSPRETARGLRSHAPKHVPCKASIHGYKCCEVMPLQEVTRSVLPRCGGTAGTAGTAVARRVLETCSFMPLV